MMPFAEDLFDLTDKVAIVTGGTGVLGGAMAQALGRAGVKVGVLGRRKDAAEQAVNDIKNAGGTAMALPASVLDEEQLHKAAKQVKDEWGHIDILVNAAGGNMPGATIMPDKTLFDLSMDDFRQVTNLNLMGTVLPCKVFGKSMTEQQSGVIINISSMAAQRPLTRVIGYGASKAAIDNLTKWLAVEMAQKHSPHIRVNAIAPAFLWENKTVPYFLTPTAH